MHVLCPLHSKTTEITLDIRLDMLKTAFKQSVLLFNTVYTMYRVHSIVKLVSNEILIYFLKISVLAKAEYHKKHENIHLQ